MYRHIYDWNIVNCDVKQPIQLFDYTDFVVSGFILLEFIGVLRHMQRYFSYVCDRRLGTRKPV